jgi:hypothetical protein
MIDIEHWQIVIEVVLHVRANKRRREQRCNQQKYVYPPALPGRCIGFHVETAEEFRTRRLSGSGRAFKQIFGKHGVEVRRNLRLDAFTTEAFAVPCLV